MLLARYMRQMIHRESPHHVDHAAISTRPAGNLLHLAQKAVHAPSSVSVGEVHFIQRGLGNKKLGKLIQQQTSNQTADLTYTRIAGKRLNSVQPTSVDLQRQETEEEHNLRSATLQGDSRLESCYDGEVGAYIRFGANGEYVTRIQQGLIKLGYSLPVYGVDGKFGSETAAAIRSFQNDQRLTPDAVVGMLTLTALDDLLSASQGPGPNGKDPKTPDEDKTCPAPSTVNEPPSLQTAPARQTKRGVKTQAKTRDGSAFRKNVVSGDVVQRAHRSIGDAVVTFSTRINSSQKSDPAVTERGQFYWSTLIHEKIWAIVTKSLPLGVDQTRKDFAALLDAIWDEDARQIAILVKKITDRLNGSSGNKELLTLFKPAPENVNVGLLWKKFNEHGRVPPDSDKLANLNIFQKIRLEEKTACWSVAELMMSRFYKQGGFGKERPAKNVSFALSNSTAMREFEWKNGTVRGDVVNYGSIGPTIKKMKDVLDDGFILHARVVSGVNTKNGLDPTISAAEGKTPVPPPAKVNVGDEHSLVIIGYDGDEFVFWDPDSNASKNRLKPGFGKLFFQNDRLTTARTDADLFVDKGGDHLDGDHRYQVLRVTTE